MSSYVSNPQTCGFFVTNQTSITINHSYYVLSIGLNDRSTRIDLCGLLDKAGPAALLKHVSPYMHGVSPRH